MSTSEPCEQCGGAEEVLVHGKMQPCDACCPHDEFDHDICLDCGYERDPGEQIDRAMDLLGD